MKGRSITLWLLGLLPVIAQAADATPVVVYRLPPAPMPVYNEVVALARDQDPIVLTAPRGSEVVEALTVGAKVESGAVVATLKSISLELQISQVKSGLIELQAAEKLLRQQREAINSLSNAQYEATLRLAELESEIQIHAAKIRLAHQQINQLLVSQQQLTLVSPVDGVVTQLIRQPAEFVDEFEPVIIIGNQSSPFLQLNLSLNSSNQLKVGDQLVAFKDGTRLVVVIESIHPVSVDRSVIYEARLRPVEEQKEIHAGSAFAIRVPRYFDKAIQTIPNDALVINQVGTYVRTVDETMRTNEYRVNVIDRFQDLAIIDQALPAESLLIVRGNNAVHAGSRVAIADFLDEG
ncbi:MAG: hypothetical protein Tsb002_04270 [Wenzhouxiangellaceae bacterium]